ncbi:hypothetical protein ACIBO1_28385 [Micromonospora sp. NPDC049903]|uniref:hypothetical protein n=1 Tax=Micromonospora sp. NPDC049903 TaxID=3364276 RepID=UPI00379CE357
MPPTVKVDGPPRREVPHFHRADNRRTPHGLRTPDGLRAPDRLGTPAGLRTLDVPVWPELTKEFAPSDLPFRDQNFLINAGVGVWAVGLCVKLCGS